MLVCPGQRDCTMSPDGSERGSTERHSQLWFPRPDVGAVEKGENLFLCREGMFKFSC